MFGDRDPLKISPPKGDNLCLDDRSTVTQTFTPIDGTSAEISVPEQKFVRDKQVGQQDAYPTNAGNTAKTMCNIPPPAPFSKATFPSLTGCLYLLDSRD